MAAAALLVDPDLHLLAALVETLQGGIREREPLKKSSLIHEPLQHGMWLINRSLCLGCTLTRGEPGNSDPIIAHRRETETAERKSSKAWRFREERAAKEECEGKRGRHFICCRGVLNTKYIQHIRSRNQMDIFDTEHKDSRVWQEMSKLVYIWKILHPAWIQPASHSVCQDHG